MKSLPDGWTRVTVGDFAHVEHGWPFKSAEYSTDAEHPIVVGIGNFDYAGGFRFDRTSVKRYAGEYPKAFELEAGDLLLVMTCQTEGGEILGLPGIVPHDGETYLHNQRIGRVVIDDPAVIVPDFLFHLARSATFNGQLVVTASGSKILHTSPTRISAVLVNLPPVAEQRAIAEVLGALDDKIAANTRLATTTEELALAVYDSDVSGVPLASMDGVLEPVLGGTPARDRTEYWNGDVPWASARDVAGAPLGVILQTLESISSLAASTTRARRLAPGTVVLTARGTVGAVGRLPDGGAVNQSCYAFEPDPIPPGVLYLMVRRVAESLQGLVHGSVFDTITMSTFQHVSVPELDAVRATGLERRTAPLLGVVESRIRENLTLAATRDALLPALMSGALRVRDAVRLAADLT